MLFTRAPLEIWPMLAKATSTMAMKDRTEAPAMQCSPLIVWCGVVRRTRRLKGSVKEKLIDSGLESNDGPDEPGRRVSLPGWWLGFAVALIKRKNKTKLRVEDPMSQCCTLLGGWRLRGLTGPGCASE